MTEPSRQQPDGVVVACGEIFRVATDACEKKGAKRSGDALVAIVFAQSAIEAFTNEIVWPAKYAAPLDQGLASLVTVGYELVERENLRLKIKLIRSVLGGSPYDESRNPYQDFKFLVDLRNEIVHPKVSTTYTGDARAGEVEVEYSKRIEALKAGLKSRDLWKEPQSTQFPHIIHWLGCLRSPATEKWACKTALAITSSIRDLVKQPDMRKVLDLICDTIMKLPA